MTPPSIVNLRIDMKPTLRIDMDIDIGFDIAIECRHRLATSREQRNAA
jgi:hypothetical protein